MGSTSIILETGSHFSLEQIFTCGQCFRWRETGSDTWSGVAFGEAVTARVSGAELIISGDNPSVSRWREYFDLDRDYGEIIRSLELHEFVKTAARFGSGIRILRQEFWEAMCSFIISQCNNIPRIQGIITRLCEHFGRKLSDSVYAFPDAGTVAGLSAADLAPLRCGYRAPYIIEAAKAVESGAVSRELLCSLPLEDARRELMRLPGIGRKVADCVLLYGAGRLESFPVDVWIKRAISEDFGQEFDPKSFGEYAGIAQQYIFYYKRSGSA